jgi:3,4-dihydroxy-2-butanone 4-phosphate synthase
MAVAAIRGSTSEINRPDRVFRVKPSQDLVASEDGKSEVVVLAQVCAGISQDLLVPALHDLGESIRVEEGRRMHHQERLRLRAIASTSATSLSDSPA